MKRARFQAGLNDYEYCVSLHISATKLTSREIGQRLGMDADRSHDIGDPKRSQGVYEESYWCKELSVRDGVSYGDFIEVFTSQCQEHAQTLRDIYEAGGRIEMFIGLFAARCCDECISCENLRRLADLRVDLRLDYYPSNDSQSH
jgi:hypothetical protein